MIKHLCCPRAAWLSIALLLMALLAAGCGFQLRGYTAIPEHLQQLAIETDNPRHQPWVRAIRQQLGRSGAIVTPDAAIQLKIVSVSSQRRAASYTANAKIAEYALIELLEFELWHDTQGNLLPSTRLSSERIYRFDQNNMSGTDQEENLIRQELMHDIIQQLAVRMQQLPPPTTTKSAPPTIEPVPSSTEPPAETESAHET